MRFFLGEALLTLCLMINDVNNIRRTHYHMGDFDEAATLRWMQKQRSDGI